MRRILQVSLLFAALLSGPPPLGASGGDHSGPREEAFTNGSLDMPAALRASEPVRSAVRLSGATRAVGGASSATPRVGSLFPARLGPDIVAAQLRRNLAFRRVLARAHLGLDCWSATAPPLLHSA